MVKITNETSRIFAEYRFIPRLTKEGQTKEKIDFITALTKDTPKKEGITAITQPGGSERDFESITACNEANVTWSTQAREASSTS